jgi:hypothetical protein
MTGLWEWFRDTFVRPPVAQPPVRVTVPDPDPPLGAHVMFCPKCGAERGSGWSYAYRPAEREHAVTVRFVDVMRYYPVEVCARDEHVRVTCTCGYHWTEQTVAKIHAKADPTFQPFPTFMQAWEWLRTTGGYDEDAPLRHAGFIASAAQTAVADSEEGLALYVAAVAVLREQGVLE